LENIHPIFDQILNRSDKEKLLNQHSIVVWFTGLSGSGKSAIAKSLEKKMHYNGFITQVLDADNVRTGINNNLKFTVEDRKENIRRIAEVSKLFLNSGMIIIDCFISPTEAIRNHAKSIIGEKDFIEIFVNTPIEVCEERDTKGLYKKARAGLIKNFTGIDSPYEEPKNPFIEVKTEDMTVEDSVEYIFKKILPIIEYK
jgi:adenylylsulfate kinase